MSYASRSGRARTSPSNPRAFGVCDRCARWWNRDQLLAQYDWRGAALANLNIYVCRDCYDTPQEQLRAIVLPADPVPISIPRTEPFVYDSSGNSPVYGEPVGLIQSAVMPYNGATQTAYRVKLPVLSVSSSGGTTISVTCSAVHNLSTNDQISVEGLSNVLACGFFSVTANTATAFTYTTALSVTAGSLLTATSNIITALVGLPYDQQTIPQL